MSTPNRRGRTTSRHHGRHRVSRGAAAQPGNETLPLVELVTGSPAHRGTVVARDEDGRVVFVRHALPSERVRARLTATKKSLAWADAIEVLEPSVDRIPSVWPEAGPGGVGGGELCHVAPDAQLRWKEHVVCDQFRRIGGEALAAQLEALGEEAVRVHPTPGDAGRADVTGWRSRVEFVIDSAGRPAMYAYRGHSLHALESLPLVMPQICAVGLLDEASPWRSLWKPGDRVRVAAQTGVESPRVLVAIASGPGATAVYDSQGQVVDDTRLTHRLTVDGHDFTYHVRMEGFWQAHHEGAQVLATTVARMADCHPGDAVLELYAGAGLFSAVLAHNIGPDGHLVTIEGDEAAVADAADNVATWANTDVCVGWIDDEAVLDAVGMLGRTPRVVVMDPPRDGAGQEVCARVASLGADRIVLVSCDPAAGARDLRTLTEAGYVVRDIHVWDLYPYTHHVETVSLLVKDE